MRFCDIFFFFFNLTQETIEGHVKGDGGIAGKMKKISLENRYCSVQGFVSPFEPSNAVNILFDF